MLITQTTEFRSVLSPRTMAGIALVTKMGSNQNIKNPTHKAESAAHGLTCLAITQPPTIIHNRKIRHVVRLPMGPGNPPRLKILDQPLSPVQLRLPLVMRIRIVDPVHNGHLQLPHM